MKAQHTKSIKETIHNLQQFLECDLYTKFRPEYKLETWLREDTFSDQREFLRYLKRHFNVLRKEIIRLIGKNKFEEEINHIKTNKMQPQAPKPSQNRFNNDSKSKKGVKEK